MKNEIKNNENNENNENNKKNILIYLSILLIIIIGIVVSLILLKDKNVSNTNENNNIINANKTIENNYVDNVINNETNENNIDFYLENISEIDNDLIGFYLTKSDFYDENDIYTNFYDFLRLTESENKQDVIVDNVVYKIIYYSHKKLSNFSITIDDFNNIIKRYYDLSNIEINLTNYNYKYGHAAKSISCDDKECKITQYFGGGVDPNKESYIIVNSQMDKDSKVLKLTYVYGVQELTDNDEYTCKYYLDSSKTKFIKETNDMCDSSVNFNETSSKEFTFKLNDHNEYKIVSYE